MTTESTSERQWQTQATFLLEFQTCVIDETLEEQTYVVCQDSHDDEIFPGAGGQSVQDWMLERYRSGGSRAPSDSIEDASPESGPDAQSIDFMEAPAAGTDEASESTATGAIAPSETQTDSDNQAPTPATAEAEATSDRPLPEPDLQLTVNVLKVRLFQPPKIGKPIVVSKESYSFPSPLLSGKPFDLEIFFEIPELDQRLLQTTIHYQVEGFAKSLGSPGNIVPLGMSDPTKLISYQTHYDTVLERVSLPQGLYRAELLIHFSGAPIQFGFCDIPRFQVVQ